MWIDVNKELPQEGKCVVALEKDGEEESYGFARLILEKGEKKWVADYPGSSFSSEKVILWMPLEDYYQDIIKEYPDISSKTYDIKSINIWKREKFDCPHLIGNWLIDCYLKKGGMIWMKLHYDLSEEKVMEYVKPMIEKCGFEHRPYPGTPKR